ncbi:Proteinase inhibitor I13 [Theobroma cacao]|nr:Proteinase inhibitor I13 [Theobroma cacao]
MPFGAPRRGCPGIYMEIATMELALANLLCKFDWEMPVGMNKDDLDFNVIPGVVMHKKRNALCLVGHKFTWPELVRKNGQVAKSTIEKDNPEVTVRILPPGRGGFSDFVAIVFMFSLTITAMLSMSLLLILPGVHGFLALNLVQFILTMPKHLKSCFLYLGMFPEDYAVNCARLVRLWIAEGFVKQRDGATLEEVAREYLTELIHRNLVQAELVDYDGVVRNCRVHDLMHEVILSKADELNLIQTSAKNIQCPNQTARYLSIKDESNNVSRSGGCSKTHSIIFFEVNEFPKSLLSSLFVNFILLKELDFEGVPLNYLPEELGNLLHLKYLSVRDTKVKMLLKSLAKLRNLGTLDLKRSLVRELPVEINKLSNLQHLIAYSEDYDTRQGLKIRGTLRSLNSLEKLYYVDMNAQNNFGFIRELGSLKHLRKLGITNLKSEGGNALCNAIEHMSYLESLDVISVKENELLQLQSMSSPPLLLYCLRLQGRLEKLPDWISELKCLVRIRLFWSQLSDIPLKQRNKNIPLT